MMASHVAWKQPRQQAADAQVTNQPLRQFSDLSDRYGYALEPVTAAVAERTASAAAPAPAFTDATAPAAALDAFLDTRAQAPEKPSPCARPSSTRYATVAAAAAMPTTARAVPKPLLLPAGAPLPFFFSSASPPTGSGLTSPSTIATCGCGCCWAAAGDAAGDWSDCRGSAGAAAPADTFTEDAVAGLVRAMACATAASTRSIAA